MDYSGRGDIEQFVKHQMGNKNEETRTHTLSENHKNSQALEYVCSKFIKKDGKIKITKRKGEHTHRHFLSRRSKKICTFLAHHGGLHNFINMR